MHVQTVRLPYDLANRLDKLAKLTQRSKTSFIREALEQYLEAQEDIEKSLARIRDPQAEWMDHDEVKRALDLD